MKDLYPDKEHSMENLTEHFREAIAHNSRDIIVGGIGTAEAFGLQGN